MTTRLLKDQDENKEILPHCRITFCRYDLSNKAELLSIRSKMLNRHGRRQFAALRRLVAATDQSCNCGAIGGERRAGGMANARFWK